MSGDWDSSQGENGVLQKESVREQQPSSKSAYIRTAFVCVSCILVGIYTNILGPSLLEVEYFTGSNTKTISALFIWRHGGYLLGSLVVGPLVDRFDEYFLVSSSFAVMMAAVAVSPWWRELMVFGVMFAIGGVANAICVVNLVTAILTIWGARSDPFQQAAFFSLNIGTALSPQVFKAFMSSRQRITQHLANGHISQALCLNHSKYDSEELTRLMNCTAAQLNNSLVDGEGSRPNSTTGITFQYGYIIVAVCLLCGYVLNTGILCFNGFQFRKQRKFLKCSSMDKNRNFIEGIPKMLVLLQQFLLGYIMSAIEETFTGLLITFLVKHLGWGDKVASDMITVYLIGSATSRGLGIIVARFLQASKVIAIQVVLILIGYLLLTFALYAHWIVPWISAALIGLGFGAFYAALINWENSCMELKGKETSIIFISVSIGKMTSPFFVGYLFEEHSPTWFIHIGLIYAILLVIMYVVKYITVWYFMKKADAKAKSGSAEETEVIVTQNGKAL